MNGMGKVIKMGRREREGKRREEEEEEGKNDQRRVPKLPASVFRAYIPPSSFPISYNILPHHAPHTITGVMCLLSFILFNPPGKPPPHTASLI
jgi:hypothetical protein